MAIKQYDIIFKGETVDGVDLQTAKQQLAGLFKISDDKAEALFTGKSITLKRNLPFAMANKYRVAIKKAGSLVEVVEVGQVAKAADAVESATDAVKQDHASQDVKQNTHHTGGDENTHSDTALSEKVSAAMESVSTLTQKPDTAASFDILPVGANLMDASNEHVVSDIDVSHISARENQGLLVDESERDVVDPVNIDTSQLSVGQIGEDVLSEDERVKPIENTVDVSHLALDASDTPLEASRHAASLPTVDTSHLSLVEAR